MSDPKTPAWYSKPVSLSAPAGLGALILTLLLGSGLAGGVGAATRDADLAAVADQVRAEQQRELAAAEKVHAARYEEILRRLDRIERQLDEAPRGAGRGPAGP
jgi:hypothetical protein